VQASAPSRSQPFRGRFGEGAELTAREARALPSGVSDPGLHESMIQRFNDSTIQRFNDSTIQRFNDLTI
jgi:hypothetical protein